MDFSKVRLVVSDMDGTLLNHDGKVSDRFFNQFEELKKHNIHFVAASGRQYQSIINKLFPIKDDISIIGENGSIMQYNDKVEILLTLQNIEILEVISLLRTIKNSHIVLCGINAAYVESDDSKFLEVLNEYYTSYKVVADLTDSIDDEFLKIAIYHFKSSEDHILPYVKHWESQMQVTVSGQNWLDISNIDANKAYALALIQNRLKISAAETLAFGDYNNDLKMLELADFSYAMENAHQNVKEVARYQTHSNSAFGVELILEQLISSRN